MRTLQGAYEGVLPSKFALESGEMRQSSPNSVAVIQLTCLRLKMADCTYYSAKSRAKSFQIEFQLLNVEGKWQVVEMNLSGLSVQQTYMSMFASALKSSSVEILLEQLRARLNS
ncbi:Toluene tolerance, Ttg2 [compost metagenome]